MDRRHQLERLYADHAPAVLAYARRRIDPATADDVLSEVFVVAWRRIDDVPGEPRTWLLGIARKSLANHRRAADRHVALLERLAAEPGTAEVGDPDAIEGDLFLALAALKPADREVLLLIAWDQQTPEQAARILGIRSSVGPDGVSDFSVTVRGGITHRADFVDNVAAVAFDGAVEPERWSWTLPDGRRAVQEPGGRFHVERP